MILLIWIVNFIISCFNAWGCGKTWNETKYNGGMAHFMNWMAAIMSASGFTWCYLIIIMFFGSQIPFEHADGQIYPYLTAQSAAAVANLGYLVIILPILGSGLAITIHTWGIAYRNRTIGNIALGGYNSFAQIYNTYGAIKHGSTAFGSTFNFFNSKNNDKGKVLLLVALAAIGGILTTYIIIKKTAEHTAKERSFKYQLEV